MAQCCWKQGCELEVQYTCQCLSSVAYFCEFHLQAHLKLPNRIHSIDSILTEPSEFTKDIVLKFLGKEKAKKEKLEKIAKAFLNKYTNNTKIKSGLNDLKSDLKEIKCLIEKISQVEEKDPLDSSVSQNDADKKEIILKNDLDEFSEVRLFFKLNQLRNKTSEILTRATNDPETEQDFRRACSLYENQAPNSLFNQAYQEFIKGYQKLSSTYNIFDNQFYIYNTEIEKEEIKTFDTPEKIDFACPSTQLPNGEVFFIGSKISCTSFILDKNYQIRNLPSGAPQFCFLVIYFDKSIYCFGKRNTKKFDLNENRWNELVRMRKKETIYFNGVVFNRNILISIHDSQRIYLYSIDIDSFSIIPECFVQKKKILINTENRLYLIESEGWIYEGKDEYNWEKITKSNIQIKWALVNWSYNKGGIYIAFLYDNYRHYFKFDLNRKALIETAYYSEDFSFQRSGDRFETIKYHDNAFGAISSHPVIYIDNGNTLLSIGKKFKKLNKKIKNARKIVDTAVNWTIKGDILSDLGIYLDAIELYNKSIEIDPNEVYAYNSKGYALQKLGRHLEAIEYFNEAIKLSHKYLLPYNNKGNSLQKLGKHLEAIECYNEWIKLEPENENSYLNKGNALMNLGRYIEAIECYNVTIKIKLDYAAAYNSKGEALYNLDRHLEAIDSYNVAIKFKIDEPLFYRNRANAFNKVGREIEALKDFNKADDLMRNL